MFAIVAIEFGAFRGALVNSVDDVQDAQGKAKAELKAAERAAEQAQEHSALAGGAELSRG
jgi:hypothetical protein